ncbi:MAG: HAMP domain-containing sensor histidine kinase [Roseibium sp.]|uniref:sensor histidine kinase n=1 Tax=Roseibium sp. TaxID=1936156 RepID=UPI003298D0FC
MGYEARTIRDEKTAINRRRAMRRREVARTVRDVRTRIGSNDSLPNDFELERQHLFADTRLNSAFAVPMLALIVAAISSLWIHPALVGFWFILNFCMHLLAIGTCRAYEQAPSASRQEKPWLRRFTLSDLLYGSSWALFFLLPKQNQTGDGFLVFQFATMLIVVAISTMQSATLPRALLAGTLPVSLTVTATFLKQPEPIHYTLAAMAVGAQGFFFILGNQLLKNANTMLEYRAEKDHLIAELETANALSDESRRRAEEANLAKSRFLATMSHELRTPLNAILGFSEVMKDEVLGPMQNANYKSYAADIHHSGAHLLNLINEILDLSRIEAGRHELQEEAIYIDALVEECCKMMQIRAKAKDICIQESHTGDLPRIWGDERALRQVILNLLSNAVKFTPVNGTVQITLGRTEDGGQFVSIKDNGPGIPEAEIPVVLQAFGQGAVAIQSAEPGTGLGLSIVQALVTMHGGHFDLRSKLREGTEVIFTLPKSRVMESMPAYETPADRNAQRRRRA